MEVALPHKLFPTFTLLTLISFITLPTKCHVSSYIAKWLECLPLNVLDLPKIGSILSQSNRMWSPNHIMATENALQVIIFSVYL